MPYGLKIALRQQRWYQVRKHGVPYSLLYPLTTVPLPLRDHHLRALLSLVNHKPHLILIGLMGVGKSTIGRQLAACMDICFVDTDHVIESEQALSISGLFEQRGEAAFRRLEKEVLKDLVQISTPQVIATGGGMVIQKENRVCMQKYGLVIWLNVEPEAIYQRLRHNKSRPLLQQTNALKELQDLYAQREAWYRSCCDLEINSGGLIPRQVVDQIMRFVAESGHEKANISG